MLKQQIKPNWAKNVLKNSLFFGMITEFLTLFSVLFMNLTNFLMKHQLMAMQIALTVVSKMKLGI